MKLEGVIGGFTVRDATCPETDDPKRETVDELKKA